MLSFIFIVLLLFLIPGPAVIITISQTVRGGWKNGLLTALGIALGDLVHAFAAIFGLSAILMSSALAFEIVKYIGVAYLVYLGLQIFVTKAKEAEKSTNLIKPVNRAFQQGFLAEILNPKTALFFLAFLPQFVQNGSLSITVQLMILGLTFVVMSILYTSILVYITSLIGAKILVNRKQQWLEKVIGVVYIGLGLRLLLQTQE